MINVTELAFTCYPVTDIPRARAFYEDIIGLKPTMVHESEGGGWVEYEIGGGAFAIGKWESWLPSAAGASVAFEVEDFDAAIAKLKAAGVPFKMEPFPTPVCHMAFVTDPDGSSICIHKRNPGR
jgi:catechol 2,3-dioxygenase-like lactoylglutathione lyase family enzyme